MNKIDLRSDTVTLPTPEMRRAIAEAPLGELHVLAGGARPVGVKVRHTRVTRAA